jgi:hypothetical protein
MEVGIILNYLFYKFRNIQAMKDYKRCMDKLRKFGINLQKSSSSKLLNEIYFSNDSLTVFPTESFVMTKATLPLVPEY